MHSLQNKNGTIRSGKPVIQILAAFLNKISCGWRDKKAMYSDACPALHFFSPGTTLL